MIPRFLPLALSFAFVLAACAGPDEADPMREIATEAPLEAAPVVSDTACVDPGDGIGGTGCAVD